jgi:hypothetical protein
MSPACLKLRGFQVNLQVDLADSQVGKGACPRSTEESIDQAVSALVTSIKASIDV